MDSQNLHYDLNEIDLNDYANNVNLNSYHIIPSERVDKESAKFVEIEISQTQNNKKKSKSIKKGCEKSKDMNKNGAMVKNNYAKAAKTQNHNYKSKDNRWQHTNRRLNMTIRDSIGVVLNEKSVQDIRRTQYYNKNSIEEETEKLELLDYISNIIINCDEDKQPPEEYMFKRKQKDTLKITNSIYLSNEMTIEEKEEMYVLSLALDTNDSMSKLSTTTPEVSNTASQRTFIIAEKLPIEKDLLKILNITDEQGKTLKRKYQHLQENSNISVIICQAQNLKTMHIPEESNFYYLADIVSMGELENEKFTLNERAADSSHKASIVSNTYNPKWNQTITLSHKGGHQICVEIWNHATEKKGLLNFKMKKSTTGDELVGRCLIPLNNLRDFKNRRLDLLSPIDNSIKGNIILSITKDLNIPILKYSDHEKYLFFQKFIVEVASRDTALNEGVRFGKLGNTMEAFSRKLAARLNINEFQICASHWAYSSSIMKLTKFKLEINYNLVTLDSTWELDYKRLPPEVLKNLIDTIKYYYQREVERVKMLLFVIPPNGENCEQEVSELIDIISKWYDFLKKRNALTDHNDIGVADDIIKHMSYGIETWYKRIAGYCRISEETLIEQVKAISLLSRYILAALKVVGKGYQKPFSRIDINYQMIFIMIIDPLLCRDVESLLQAIRSDEVVNKKENKNNLNFQIFNLYCKIRLICFEIKSFTTSDQRPKIRVLGSEEWFRHFLTGWLKVLNKATHEGVMKAIDADEDLEKQNKGMLISTSAIDIAVCLAPNYFFYDKFKLWSEPIEKLHTTMQTVLLVREILTQYIEHMGEKMKHTTEKIECSLSNPFLINKKMCRILNNTYFARQYLMESATRMDWNSLKQAMDNMNIQRNDDIVNKTVSDGLEDIIQKEFELTDIIGEYVKKQLNLYFEKYLNIYRENNVNEAISPLMAWLLANVNNMIEYLTEELFLPILKVLWYLILDIYHSFMTNKCYGQKMEKAIYESLEIIYDFFYNEGNGIAEDLNQKSKYKTVYDYFSAHVQPSEVLIKNYGQELAEKTKQAKDNQKGCTLTFSIIYYEMQERFEIDIVELNSQKFPVKLNLYIQASFIPAFDTQPVKTKAVKYQTNVYIDEVLQLNAPREAVNSGLIIELAVNYTSPLQNERLGGVIYINSNDVGRGSFNLEDIITRNSIHKSGKLLKMNLIFPENDNSYLLMILKERNDPAAVKFIDKLHKLEKSGQSLTSKMQQKNNAHHKSISNLVHKLL